MNPLVRSFALFVLGSAVILTSACLPWQATGQLRTEPQVVEAGGAESARVEIRMGAGKLQVSGGANALMDAEFVYNVDRWKPNVSYEVTAQRGQLIVEQPSSVEVNLGKNMRYEWNIRLGKELPLDLSVSLGAGESKLDLRDVAAQTIEITSGASSTTLNVPARTLTRLEITTGVGSATVDLTGDWKHNLKANIKGGTGSVIIRLPKETGVRAKVVGGLGKVNANGFRVSDDAYVNDAYDKTDVNLDIEVIGGVGSVTLELVG